MKILLALVLIIATPPCVVLGKDCGGGGCNEVPASIEPGNSAAVSSYEDFMGSTYNRSCSSCGCSGCCPVIVRNCAPKFVGSVINGVPGWRGNAAIIIDWGCTEYNPCSCKPKGRLCTLDDKGYRWYIDWGDGQHDYGFQLDIGPFQKIHQYSKSCRSRTYAVTVYFCHDPGCPSERCCDSIRRRIDVSESPNNPHADIDFDKPLSKEMELEHSAIL